MYILLEHSGTSDNVQCVKKIRELLEDDFDATVEEIIGLSNKVITLYSEKLKKITEISPLEDISVISFYIKNYYKDEL